MAAPASIVILSDDDDSNSSAPQTQAAPAKRNFAVKRGSLPQPPPPAPPPQQSQTSTHHKIKRDMENIANSTFLSDFNPLNSRREKNKQYRNLCMLKQKPAAKKQSGSLYDEQGKIRSSGEDICDCFEKDCEGCHFPCEWCNSPKCGLRCRNSRRWMYEVIEYDGKDKVTVNTNMTKQ